MPISWYKKDLKSHLERGLDTLTLTWIFCEFFPLLGIVLKGFAKPCGINLMRTAWQSFPRTRSFPHCPGLRRGRRDTILLVKLGCCDWGSGQRYDSYLMVSEGCASQFCICNPQVKAVTACNLTEFKLPWESQLRSVNEQVRQLHHCLKARSVFHPGFCFPSLCIAAPLFCYLVQLLSVKVPASIQANT